MKAICNQCENEFEIKTSAYNRAKKRGSPIYCNIKCSGLGRRKNISIEEKKHLKAEYDREYRRKNKDKIIERKKKYWKQPHVKDLWKLQRQRRMPKHVEYCRKPEYKKWKKEYDHEYRAKKTYGEFWESLKPLLSIQDEVDNRLAKKELGLINKSQKRKRLCQKNKEISMQII